MVNVVSGFILDMLHLTRKELKIQQIALQNIGKIGSYVCMYVLEELQNATNYSMGLCVSPIHLLFRRNFSVNRDVT